MTDYFTSMELGGNGGVGDWGMVLGLNDNGESDTVRNGIQMERKGGSRENTKDWALVYFHLRKYQGQQEANSVTLK